MASAGRLLSVRYRYPVQAYEGSIAEDACNILERLLLEQIASGERRAQVGELVPADDRPLRKVTSELPVRFNLVHLLAAIEQTQKQVIAVVHERADRGAFRGG